MVAAENTSAHMEKWELSRQSLVNVLTESHYSPREFAEALGAPSFMELLKSIKSGALPWLKALFKAKVYAHVPGLNRRFAKESGRGGLFKRTWEIQSYTFTYRSQTIDGRASIMSGRITFLHHRAPNIPHQAKTISLHIHQAFFNPQWAPFHNLMFVPLKVLWDSVVIEPDLQKWGITHGVESDGSGSAIRTVRQIADCVVAALEIMRQHHVRLAPEGYTTNWGGSQGAMPTLCFDKWYDTEAPQWFKEELRLRSSFIVEGVSKVHVLTKYIYQNGRDFPLKPVTLVGYLKAFTPEQLGGYKPQELVPQWWNDTKFQVNGREISFFDAVCHYIPEAMFPLSDTVSCYADLVAPDMLTPDGQVEMTISKVQFAKDDVLHTTRMIECWGKDGKHATLLTNNFELSEQEIVAIYDNRWQIELLFKQLKQNFPLKYFYGESVTAIESLIWVCLIANLLLNVVKPQGKASLGILQPCLCGKADADVLHRHLHFP